VEAENKEFMQLLEASGWNQAEAARRLYLSPSNITQYKKNDNRPSRQVLELFKLLLAQEKPAALAAITPGRGLTPLPEGETESWKRRAKNAEQDLAELRTGLRKLLESKPSSKSKVDTALQTLVDDALDETLRNKK
jgi:transcriptional regulator with XRE-family HTH domain